MIREQVSVLIYDVPLPVVGKFNCAAQVRALKFFHICFRVIPSYHAVVMGRLDLMAVARDGTEPAKHKGRG